MLIAPPYVHVPALFALIAAAVAPNHVIFIVFTLHVPALYVYPELHAHATTARPALVAVHCDSYPVVYCDELGDGHDVANCVPTNVFFHTLLPFFNRELLYGNKLFGIKPDKLLQPPNVLPNTYVGLEVSALVLILLNKPDGIDVSDVQFWNV